MSSSSSPSPSPSTTQESRRFFKVMVPGFHSKLVIPPAFCLKLKGENSEKGTLIVTNGEKVTYNVEIGRSDENIIWFDKGWDEFVQKHKLRVGDFAVFEHLGDMNFSVTLLDSSGCDKKISVLEDGDEQVAPSPVKRLKSADCTNKKRKPDGDGPHCQYVKGSSEFTARIKEYNVRKRSPYMHIPTEFCQSHALFHNTTVRLTGPSGEVYPVSLRTCSGGKTLYMCMTTGWRAFFSSNKLKVGDYCIFQLDHTKSDATSIAMDVRIM